MCIRDRNEYALKSSLNQLKGSIRQVIEDIRKKLIYEIARIESALDDPEHMRLDGYGEELSPVVKEQKQKIERLLEKSDQGKLMQEGIKTVIVGKPNAGKSSLLNLLAGEEKAIVTDIAGTTRDVVEEQVQLGDLQLLLSDTAGIRETEDAVEQIGVHFAQERIQQSDLILAVFDASRPFSSEDRRIVEEVSKQPVPAIAVIHKTDLPAVLDETELGQGFQQVVHTSVENTQSLDLLQQAIQQVLHLVQLEEGAAVLANERQRSCVIRAKDHLSQAIAAFQAGYTLDAVTVDLTDGVSALLELTGEKASDAVVDEVFRNFCVGK